jgi:hypothetical protein
MMKALDRAFRVTESLKLAEEALAPRRTPSRWKPFLIGAGVGTGAFLLLWLFFRGRGTGRSGNGDTGKLYKVDRVVFSISKDGASYQGSMVALDKALAIAREIDPAIVELRAAGDAVVSIVRETRDAFIKAGFHVVGNPAVLEA